MFHIKHRNYDEFFEMNQDMSARKEELIKWAEEYVKENIQRLIKEKVYPEKI